MQRSVYSSGVHMRKLRDIFGNREYSDLLNELRQRLINTESKVDQVLRLHSADFFGHPDQRYGHLTYSQHGEDLVFVALFEQLNIAKPTYLDIGANHPINCSNTALLYKRGARGVNVDASPDVIRLFDAMRPDDKNVNVGIAGKEGVLTFFRMSATSGRNSFSRDAIDELIAKDPHKKMADEIQVPVITLDEAMSLYFGDNVPDLVSIDAEGLDLEILQTLSFKKRPKIFCIETISSAGEYEGEMHHIMVSNGYRKCIQMYANAIYLDGALQI